MATDVTSDPDFMAANPSDQMRYLSAIDPDFAKASPQDQMGYLRHVRGFPAMAGPAKPQLDMQKSNLAIAASPTQSVAGPGEASYVAQADPGSQARMLGAAAIGAGGTSGVLPWMAKKAAPVVVPGAASYAINQARKLPYIGPVIDKIPFAEALPWLMMGGKTKSEGGAPIERDATRLNEPYAGEYDPAAEDAALRTSPGFRNPSVQEPIPLKGGPLKASDFAINREAAPAEASVPATPAEPSYTPNPREGQGAQRTPYAWEKQQVPFLRGYGEAQDDAAVTQKVRDYHEAQGAIGDKEAAQQFAANNTVGTPKGVMAQQFKKTSPAPKPGPQTLPVENLAPEWQKALEALRAKKRQP
jgi:hypothetical protein